MLYDVLTKEKVTFFEDMIPEEVRPLLGLPGTLAVGASLPVPKKQEESDGEMEAEPVGLLLLSTAQRGRIEVLWLYVEEEYREREIGTELLSVAFELAKQMDRSLAAIVENAPEDGSFDGTSAFLFDRGFIGRGPAMLRWQLFGADEEGSAGKGISDSKKGQTLSKSVKKLLELPPREKKRVFAELEKDGRESFPPCFPELVEEAESLVLTDKAGSVTAALLIERYKGGCTPFTVFFKKNQDKALTFLAELWLQEFFERAKPGERLIVLASGETEKRIFEKVMGKRPFEALPVLYAEADGMDTAEESLKRSETLLEKCRQEDRKLPESFVVKSLILLGDNVIRLQGKEEPDTVTVSASDRSKQ